MPKKQSLTTFLFALAFEEDISMISKQCSVTEEVARQSLMNCGGDIAEVNKNKILVPRVYEHNFPKFM